MEDIYVAVGLKKQTIPTPEKIDFVLMDETPHSDFNSQWEIRDIMVTNLNTRIKPYIEEARTKGVKLSIGLFFEWEDEVWAAINGMFCLNQLPEEIVRNIAIYCGYFPGCRGAYIWPMSFNPGKPLEDGQRAHGG